MSKPKTARPSDRYLSEATTRMANGFRTLVIEEFEKFTADGYDPYYARYGVLTANIISMGDVIGASSDPVDRNEMREFLMQSGAALLMKLSEAVAEHAAEETRKRDMH